MRYIHIKEVDKMVKQHNNRGNGRTMRIYTAWYSTLLVLSATLLILAGCPETPADQSDTTAPEPIAISNANVTVSSSSISLQWQPSPSDDVAEVQVTWTPKHGEEQPKIIAVGNTNTTITGLNANTPYALSIIAIDTSDNKSGAVEISATTNGAVSFVQDSYSFEDIDITLGSLVGSVSATTEDSNVAIEYTIVSSENSALFVINSSTGDITVADSGLNAEQQYLLTVQATSGQGATATVDVRVIPLDTIAPAPVTSLSATPNSGTAVTLNWIDSASEDASTVRITWIVTDSNDSPDSKEITDEATMTSITGLTSETSYTFTLTVVDGAGNASMPKTAVATTADITGPLPVTIQQVTNSGTAVTLTWIDSTSEDAAMVLITWMAEGSNDVGGPIEVLDDVQTATITGLTSETSYTFTLTVVDEDGNVSSAPTNTTITTADITAPAPVTAESASADNGTTVRLTWEDSISDDADEVHITWTPVGSRGADGVRIGHGTQLAIINGLSSETSYKFTLIVEDRDNNTSEPKTVTVLTPDTTGPNSVTNVMGTADASGSSVTLTWDNSASIDASFVRITWAPPRSDGVASMEIRDRATTTTITGLADGTPYTFTFTVVDNVGNTSADVPITVNTIDVTDPEPVTGVSATTMAGTTAGTSAVTLRWTNSMSTDATTIRIVWTETASGTGGGSRTVEHGTITTVVIDGLTSELRYTFTLTVLDDAVDAAGDPDPNESDEADASITTLDTVAPSPVSSFTATPLAGGTEVMLSWINSDSADAAMLEIAWRSSVGGAVSMSETIGTGMSMYTISGLIPGTPYIVTITVIDDADNRSPAETATPDPVTTLANPIDTDGDTLIDINTLEQLHNMRYNLNGTSYKTSSGDGGTLCGIHATTACTGYELTDNLTFDRDGGGTYNQTTYVLDAGDHHPTYFPVSGGTGGWLPIGDATTPFRTIFEGNGFFIRGLAVRRNQTHVGMFGRTHGSAIIRNIRLTNNLTDYTGNSGSSIYVGGLVAYNAGTISASHAGGPADGGGGNSDYVGGLVGFNLANIIASYATGDTDGHAGSLDYVGGLVGRNERGTIVASYATGDADGGSGGLDYVGGLTGFNLANITASYATGDADGGSGNTDRVGGLVGRNARTITASYATGDANGGSEDDIVGGLTGNNAVTIIASYATGTANGNSGNDKVGSLTGSNIATITASYGFGSTTGVGTAGVDSSNDLDPSALGVGIAGARRLLPNQNSFRAVTADWNKASSRTSGAWNFGTDSQAPALRYADYDGTAGNTYGCGSSSTANIVIPDRVPVSGGIPGGFIDVICGSTLLGGPQPR